MNGDTTGFCPQTHKLEPPNKTVLFAQEVKRIRCGINALSQSRQSVKLCSNRGER